MAVEWTIEHDAVTKTAAEWGVVSLNLRRVSTAADVLTFRHDGVDFDGDPLFEYGDTIKLFRDGVKWFEGRVDAVPRSGSTQSEGMAYTVVGPWWYLEHLTYQQGWNLDEGSGIIVVNKSHALLFHAIDGNKLDVAGQLSDVLNYAVNSGKPLQFEPANFPTVNPPVDEATDISCAEIIRMALLWVPDAVTWFDYSTDPPTLHIAQRGDLTAVDLDIASEDYSLDGVDVRSRPDMQVPSVFLKFEQTNTIDGQPRTAVTEQKAPNDSITGTEDGAFVATIELAGSTLQRTAQTIETSLIDVASAAWWQSWAKWLADSNVEISVDATSTSRLSSLPRALTKGGIASWMKLSSGTPVSAEKDTASARIRVSVFAPGQPHTEENLIVETDYLFSVEFVATDAPSDTYSTVVSASEGEEEPAGLAQSLYDATSTLQWQGSLEIKEEDVAGRINVGNVLNILSGRSEWTTMNAVVQEIAESIDGGVTRVTFGPARQLGLKRRIDLLRVNRFRRVFTNPAVRVDGIMRSSGNVTFTEDLLRGDVAAGGAQARRIRVGDRSDADAGEVDLDYAPLNGANTGGTPQVGKWRWTKGCDSETGEVRYAYVFRGPWVSELPPGAEVDE